MQRPNVIVHLLGRASGPLPSAAKAAAYDDRKQTNWMLTYALMIS